MNIIPSKKLQSLPAYAFAEVAEIINTLKNQGITPIDFGVGDPSSPTPDFIREATKKSVDKNATTGYPSYIGQTEFLETAVTWMQKRFNVTLDPKTELSSTIGSKEAVFHFPLAIINPGDLVIIPTPGYPPMKTGTIFAGGIPYFVPLEEKNNFLLDYNSIPENIAKQAKIIWINYPNSPTGAIATREYYEGLVAWAEKYNIIIAADEGCYIDIYFDQKPISILEVKKEGVIVFYSLSKRNNMTGYRVGWVAGDSEIIKQFKKLKTNIDSGTPNFIQDAGICALNDETHVQTMRAEYKLKKNILLDAFKEVGWPACTSEATFYLWQKVPAGFNSLSFAKKLLEPEIALIVTPGAWISDVTVNNINPGEDFVRFALMPSLEKVKLAATRIKQNFKN